MRPSVSLVFLLTALLSLSGCFSEESFKDSIIVIAIDSLSFDSIPCTDPDISSGVSGLHLLCEESVRFTHGYTVSPLAEAALASVLTGLWPYQHGARHNGANGLPGSVETAAEVALAKGARTALFSGGPPIWRRGGLDQGFELFDDNIPMSGSTFFRPAESVVSTFLSWLNLIGARTQFFSVLYLADLQVFGIDKVGANGQPVDTSFRGRLLTLDRSLGTLFQELKRSGVWDRSLVVLAGLSGVSRSDRFFESEGVNLLSENSRVILMMKPPSPKKRDLATNWKIDANVSLADVGATLFEVMDSWKQTEKTFPIISLQANLKTPEVTWDAERPILLESAWGKWRGNGDIRYAIRQGSHLLLFDEPARLFNSHADQSETTPYLGTLSIEWQPNLPLFASIKAVPWKEENSLVRKIRLAQDIWSDTTEDIANPERLQRFVDGPYGDSQTAGWLARHFLKHDDWVSLLELSQKYGRFDLAYAAASNLQQKFAMGRAKTCDAILKSFPGGTVDVPSAKECDDTLFRDLYAWTRLEAKGSSESAAHRENFLREYTYRLKDRRIAKLSFINGIVWDVDPAKPAWPERAEAFLALPLNKKIASQVHQRLRSSGVRE